MKQSIAYWCVPTVVYFLAVFLAFLTPPARAAGAAQVLPPCTGCLNVCRFRLLVEPANSGALLPIQNINILAAGEKLKYEPLHLPPAIRDRARVAILLVAAPKDESKSENKESGVKGKGKSEKKTSGKEKNEEAKQDIHVLEALPAKVTEEWKVPARATVVGVVFGPHGLNVKQVSSMVIRNPDLIPELTEYAEQTAKVGALVEALAEYQQQPGADGDVNAALSGFGKQYNVAVPRIDTSQPSSQQAAVLLQATLPSLQTFDPITDTTAGMAGQSAGLAGTVGAMFFGSPVGLAAGGTALLFNLRALVFPGTDFRSAFTQPFATNGLALCAKNEPDRPRTRIAYLWMMRVPNAAAPDVTLTRTAYVPMATKSAVTVKCATPEESRLLTRAHGWELVSTKHEEDVPVKVQVASPHDTLNLDLAQTKLPAGEYHLAALWDWQPLQVKGAVDLRSLGDFRKARVTPDSADRLVEGSGSVKVQLTGADFEFVKKLAIAKAGEAKTTKVSFSLPKGEAQGVQETLEAVVDTSAEPAGSYRLILTQTDGSTHDVPLVIHPPDPTLNGLPLRANLGEAQQTLLLRGTRLERLTAISSADAVWELASVKPGARDMTERSVTIKLRTTAHRGELTEADVSVQDIHTPLAFPGALEVAGPRPKIAGFTLSLGQEPDVHLDAGEIPAGAPISFSLSTLNVNSDPALTLACANDGFVKTPLTLHPGDRTAEAQLDFGDGGLFLSVDPGAVGQSGCRLAATITTQSAGSSDPTVLGRIVRLPRIDKFALTDDKLGTGLYAGKLTGSDLQIIEKTGWDDKNGYPVQGIATPVPGNPQYQTLQVALPWPPPLPHSPIYVWLRGETTGRLTDVRY